ncbi:MAG: hypothetical protein CMK07_08355 [Ponticaulis sp.]|nr:hypothetical protein [Ponticaulis sp.]
MAKGLIGALLAAGLLTSPSGPALAQTSHDGLIFDVPGFDRSHPATLGLPFAPEADHFTVYAPMSDADYAYNHGAVLTWFQGRYYMQWQSSFRDEDAAETRVMYAVSSDAETWSEPRILASPADGLTITNGGWVTDGETLIAYINVWPDVDDGDLKYGFAQYVASTDGLSWSAPERVLMADGSPVSGIIEQDTRALPGGRLLTAFHVEPGLIAKPYITDDPLGMTGWVEGEFHNLESEGPTSRELEPSWFVNANGNPVMVFRDQGGSFKTIASESRDKGLTWSAPVLSDFPDSRSKQSAGNLGDGTVFRVNNPRRDRERYPLVLSLSEDGQVFDRAYVVRSGLTDLPAMQHDGRYKRIGYSYPKSFVHNGFLYIAYATNKERIELTRIPVSSLSVGLPD